MTWEQDVRRCGVLAAIFGLMAPAGCRVVDDPDHCANRQGNATCDAEFPGRVCSTCQRAFSGCAQAPVEAACRPAGSGESDDGTTTAGTDASSGEDSTTVVEPAECDGEGAVDGCPADRPYCVQGVCSGCGPAGGHAYCEGLDAALPQCNVDWGRCVACVDDDSPVCRAAGNFCTTEFICGGCMRQDQCPDSACNVWSGACMDDAMRLWIAPLDGDCSDSNAGSEVAPVCTIAEADSRAPGGTAAVFYLGNGDHTVSLGATNRDIALLGVGNDVVVQQAADAPGEPAAEFSGGSRYVMHGVRVRGTDGPAVVCRLGGRLALESVSVDGGTPIAFDVDNCQVLLQRSRVTNDAFFVPGAEGALRFTSTVSPETLRLDASMIALRAMDETEFPALQLDQAALDVRGSTILALEDGGKILQCDRATTGTVHSALLAANPTTSGIDCPGVDVDHSVIDASMLGGKGLVRLPYSLSWFRAPVTDLGLRDDGGAIELAGLGLWRLGDPLLDYDGDRLPSVPGTPIDPGGDQR